MLICIIFQNKNQHWIKPGSKFLFHFVDILESKVFTERILDIFLYHSINQKILSLVIKNIYFLPVFRNKMFYKSGSEWYMNKPLCKNLQNIDRNQSGKFGVCKCCWSGEFWLRVWEKTHFEKTAFKDRHQPMRFGAQH